MGSGGRTGLGGCRPAAHGDRDRSEAAPAGCARWPPPDGRGGTPGAGAGVAATRERDHVQSPLPHLLGCANTPMIGPTIAAITARPAAPGERCPRRSRGRYRSSAGYGPRATGSLRAIDPAEIGRRSFGFQDFRCRFDRCIAWWACRQVQPEDPKRVALEGIHAPGIEEPMDTVVRVPSSASCGSGLSGTRFTLPSPGWSSVRAPWAPPGGPGPGGPRSSGRSG